MQKISFDLEMVARLFEAWLVASFPNQRRKKYSRVNDEDALARKRLWEVEDGVMQWYLELLQGSTD